MYLLSSSLYDPLAGNFIVIDDYLTNYQYNETKVYNSCQLSGEVGMKAYREKRPIVTSLKYDGLSQGTNQIMSYSI